MARKRMIHRDCFKSYEMKECNFRQRWLWHGLIVLADDEGREKAEPSIIRGEIFPFDNLKDKTIIDDLFHLESLNLIRLYSGDKGYERYYQIVNWDNYQKVDHPVESKIPEPLANDSRSPRENFSPNSNSNSNSNSMAGNETKVRCPALEKVTFNFATGSFGNITEADLALWREAYPAVEIKREVKGAASWLIANPKNRKSNYRRFLVNWFARSQEKAARTGTAKPASAWAQKTEEQLEAERKHREEISG